MPFFIFPLFHCRDGIKEEEEEELEECVPGTLRVNIQEENEEKEEEEDKSGEGWGKRGKWGKGGEHKRKSSEQRAAAGAGAR